MAKIVGSRDSGERSGLRRLHEAWAKLLGQGEQIDSAHQLARSTLIFTNRRLLLVEEGVTGRKVEYLSLPYRSITHYSVDAGGAFSPDAELKIWVAGRTAPIEKAFGSGADVYAVQALLTMFVAAS